MSFLPSKFPSQLPNLLCIVLKQQWKSCELINGAILNSQPRKKKNTKTSRYPYVCGETESFHSFAHLTLIISIEANYVEAAGKCGFCIVIVLEKELKKRSKKKLIVWSVM